MILYEKSEGTLNFYQLLLMLSQKHLAGIGEKDIDGLPNELGHIIKDKKVIFFYISQEDIKMLNIGQETLSLTRILDNLEFVHKCCLNLSGIVLWWHDDGLLEDLISNESVEMTDRYLKLVAEIKENNNVIHEKKQSIDFGIKAADICYGNDVDISGAFAKAGKQVYRQDLLHQNQYNDTCSISDWFGKLFTDKALFHEKDLLAKWRHAISGRRIVLVHFEAIYFLFEGERFIDKLHQIVDLVAHTDKLFYLIDFSHEFDDVLGFLTFDLQCKFRETYRKIRECVVLTSDVGYDVYDILPWVDVYYGDIIPGLDKYEKKGITVIIQSYEPHSQTSLSMFKGKSLAIQFSDFCLVDGCFYFSSWLSNGLYKMSGWGKSPEFICHIPDENRNSVNWGAYFSIVQKERKIYLIPMLANSVMSYSLDKGTWSKYRIPNDYRKGDGRLFSSAYVQEDSLWMLPWSSGVICCLDLQDGSLSFYTEWLEKAEMLCPGMADGGFIGQMVIGNKIYFASTEVNCLLEFDMCSHVDSAYVIGERREGFVSISHDGTYFWLLCRNGDVISWNHQEGIGICLENPLGMGISGRLACCGENLYIFAHGQDKFVKYNIKLHTLTKYENFLPEEYRDGMGAALAYVRDDNLFICPYAGELFLKINAVDGNAEMYAPRIKNNDVKYYFEGKLSSEIYSELTFVNDNEMLIFMENLHKGKKKSDSIGKRIYEIMD